MTPERLLNNRPLVLRQAQDERTTHSTSNNLMALTGSGILRPGAVD
jgi:hypothetical protein